MSRENLFSAFFFAAFLFLFYQLYLILSPFATPLILAGVVVVTFAPLTRRAVAVLGGSRSKAAAVMSLLTLAIVLIPMVILLSILADQAAELYDRIQLSVQQGGDSPLQASESWLGSTKVWLEQRFPALGSVDLAKLSTDASKRVAAWVAAESGLLVQDLASGVLSFSMMLVALFFLFRDGDRIAGAVRDLIPMEEAYKERLSKRVTDTVAAVVQSTVLIAVLQGFVGGLGYALIGRFSVSVLLGFLTAAASLVPVVGAALVWFPAALYLLGTGEVGRGAALVAWGVIAVGSVDNFVRPLVIGGRVEIPTFLLLFALLGGLQVYGFLGIFVAPVMVAVLLAFVEIYREHYGAAEVAADSAADSAAELDPELVDPG